MFCSTCGAQNPDGAKFCKACGAALRAVDDAAPSQAAGPVSPKPASSHLVPVAGGGRFVAIGIIVAVLVVVAVGVAVLGRPQPSQSAGSSAAASSASAENAYGSLTSQSKGADTLETLMADSGGDAYQGCIQAIVKEGREPIDTACKESRSAVSGNEILVQYTTTQASGDVVSRQDFRDIASRVGDSISAIKLAVWERSSGSGNDNRIKIVGITARLEYLYSDGTLAAYAVYDRNGLTDSGFSTN